MIVVLLPLGLDPAVSQVGEYSFGTGDHLRVTAFGHMDLSGGSAVNSRGRRALPPVGDVLGMNRTRDREGGFDRFGFVAG